MKIVHLCLCGVFDESYAYQDNLITKYHKLMGHDVTIIAPTYSKYDNNGKCIELGHGESYLNNGCKLIRISPLIKSFQLNLHFHLFRNFSNALINEKPDFIFVHGLNSWSYYLLPSIAKRIPAAKFAFDNHADYINSANNRISKFLNGFLVKYFIVKRLQNLSDYFYGVTPSRCTFLNEIYGVSRDKIHLLVMGADDEKMEIAQKECLRQYIRNHHSISNEDFLIVTGGKIEKKKNIHKIIEAVSTIPEKHLKILFFGSISDTLKNKIDSFVSERVIYVGWTPADQVYKYFYAADLIMFPGLHSVLWEQAVATRVPCAFSKLEGFEHINFNDNCIMLEQDNVDYYKTIISDIFYDKDKYQLLFENSDNDAADQFLYGKIASKVISDSFASN